MKKILSFLVVTVLAVTLVACGEKKIGPDTEIKGDIVIGNTAATTGAFAGVGVPFNAALEAVVEEYNKAGGFNGQNVVFKHYDDEFSSEKGQTFTEKLVEEDKVFAMVGHFGTPTVGATINYLKDEHVPMVYAATGINALYATGAKGSPILPVQPIYKTDGQLMTARAIKEKVYGANNDQALAATAKIGVVHTNADDGNSILEGIKVEAKELGYEDKLVIQNIGNGTDQTVIDAAALALKNANVETIIIASNQAPFGLTVTALKEAEVTAPVFTSYVNADVSVLDGEYGFEIYSSAWLDVFSTQGAADALKFIETLNASTKLTTEEKTAYAGNSFAIAGYVAAKVFIEGLDRVEASEKALTRNNYIKALESKEINIPMGGTTNFGGGNRIGIDSMALLKYSFDNDAAVKKVFNKVREIETLTQIRAK